MPRGWRPCRASSSDAGATCCNGSAMGFYLWVDDGLAWAQGTYEYRPMGTAVISASDLFRLRGPIRIAGPPERPPPKPPRCGADWQSAAEWYSAFLIPDLNAVVPLTPACAAIETAFSPDTLYTRNQNEYPVRAARTSARRIPSPETHSPPPTEGSTPTGTTALPTVAMRASRRGRPAGATAASRSPRRMSVSPPRAPRSTPS